MAKIKTIGDAVMEHVRKSRTSGGTSDGLEFLELEEKPENYAAANIYLAALDIIARLKEELENWKKQ